MKIILHLDLDSYFVSAERTINKELKHKPVVISSGGERSIISAASYEAKKLGAYVPMPLYQAKMKVPNIVVVKPNFGLYTLLSTRVFEYLFNNVTKKVQVASIDECFLDVSDLASTWQEVELLCKKIQNDLVKVFDLPASIGASNNKFVAKMATSINKPFGVTIIPKEDFLTFCGGWKLEKYYGIGKPTTEKLGLLGIKTIGDLARASEEKVASKIGILAKQYIAQANGEGSSEIDVELNELKGIGNEVTFQSGDKFERRDILLTLETLVEMVAQRMKNRNLHGKTISVYLKTSGNNTVKRKGLQKTLSRPIGSYEEILAEAISLFDKQWVEESLKFIGIRMTNFVDQHDASYQVSIFDKQVKKTPSMEVLEKINASLGKKALISGAELLKHNNKKQNQSRYIESDRIIKHFDVKENAK